MTRMSRLFKGRVMLTSLLFILGTSAFAGKYVLSSYLPKNPTGGTISGEYGSSAYGNFQNGYGGSTSHSNGVASATGSITSVYVWVPDNIPGTNSPDPNDLPVDAIAEETCTASYVGISGTCDNGLGFAPTIQTGYQFGTYYEIGTSTGTRYKKVPGGQTITLTCSPSAYGLSTPNDPNSWQIPGVATVEYSTKIFTPQISYKGVTEFAGDNLKFITGQQVECSIKLVSSIEPVSQGPGFQLNHILPFSQLVCSTNPFASISSLARAVQSQPPVPTVNPSSYTWAISGGMPFKNFFYGNTGGKVDLAASDLQLPQFKFFTVDRGDITISSDFIVDPPSGTTTDGNPLSFHLSETAIESVRPTLESWTIESGDVTEWLNERFGYGPPQLKPGQKWTNVRATLSDFPTNGDCGFAQLINAKREFRRIAGSNESSIFRNYNYNEYVLDNGLPYWPSSKGLSETVTWPIGANGEFSDSPNQTFSLDSNNVWISSTANDSFQTWVIFKPDPKDQMLTTWIPLAKYTWQWSGEVSREKPQDQWSDVSGSGANSNWSDSKDFPFWSASLNGTIQFHQL